MSAPGSVNRSVRLLLLAVISCGVSAETRHTEALSRLVYERLQQAQAATDAKRYPEALEQLGKLRARRGLSGYETSQIWHLTAYVHYLRGDYRAALNAYQQVLAYPQLADAITQSTLRTVAQLHYELEDHRAAIRTARQLLAQLESPEAQMLILIAQSHYQLGDATAALAPARQAVRLAETQHGRAAENWYLLLQAIYHQQGDYRAVADILRRLIRHYPHDRYLETLAGVYSQLGESQKQLALMETLYERGRLVGEAQLITLAQLQLLNDAPYKAASLLERELNDGRIPRTASHLRLAAQAWRQAREPARALPPLEQALQLTPDIELQNLVGHTYLQLERWAEAEAALTRALDGDIGPRAGDTWLLLGIAQYRGGAADRASRSFARARRFEQSAQAAKRWLAYLEASTAEPQ